MDWSGMILMFLGILVTQCSNHMVRCELTDVRLVGGPTPNKGTVEIRQDNGTWETTCGINLSINDVIVICRKLGLTGASRAIENTPYEQNSDSTTALNCNDGGADLSDCTLLATTCSSSAGAASCHGKGYLGCFVDHMQDRVFPGDKFQNVSTMTISKCIQFCNESTHSNYIYAGANHGEECYCGEASDDYTRLGVRTDADCQSPCSGDPTDSCGGVGYIAVFKIPDPVETRTTTPDIGSPESTNEVFSLMSLMSSQKLMTNNEMDVMTTSSMNIVLPPTLQPSGHISCLGVGVGEGVVIILLIATIIALVMYILRIRQKHRSIIHGQKTHDMTLVKKTSSNDKDGSFYHDIHDVNPPCTHASTLTPQGDTHYSTKIYGQKDGHAVDINDMKREETGKDADPYIEII